VRSACCNTAGSLPPLTCGADLDAVFGKVGTVVESRVIRFKDEAAKSRGFGFVTFASAAEAARAVAELNGASLGGRELYVELSEPREPRFPQPVRAGGAARASA